jgi:hypothetical protein
LNGAYILLEYLSNRILMEKIYNWKTKAEWKAYLQGRSKGHYAPSVVPSKADFEKGTLRRGGGSWIIHSQWTGSMHPFPK